MDVDSSPLTCLFGQRPFGACERGDIRLTARRVKIADRFLEHSGGNLPEMLDQNADSIGF